MEKIKIQSEFMLYNTMSKQKEVFKPKEPGQVGMYVCGVTTYDLSHIGHARAYVAFDVLYRYLRYLGYEVNYVRNFTDIDDKVRCEHTPSTLYCSLVNYVRNFTDIDDKIINRANELNEDPLDLSRRFCDEFLVDMDALQCLLPTNQPRVTDHIEDIKDMIARIIENDCAYAVDGDVYFSVDKLPSYGRLSSRNMGDNRAGERVAVDSRKRNPADFALWKAAKPGEPSWDSPWGPGRPGWHIECSAMSARYLGHSFDIHGGGDDLKFPHHENELAQSCAACPETHISHWLHNGFVTINDEKMSKSTGNFFTIRTVLESYHPLALRHFLMSKHYRSAVKYSYARLDSASDAVFYMYKALRDSEEALMPHREAKADEKTKTAKIPPDAQECIKRLQNDFESRMADDLHTPYLLNASLKETFRFMNGSVAKLKKKMQKQQQMGVVQGLITLQGQVREVLEVLGLLSALPYTEVLQQLKEKALIRAKISEDDLLRMLEERASARERKEYERSDKIREELATLGIELMDDVGKDDFTVWEPCVPKLPNRERERGEAPAPTPL